MGFVVIDLVVEVVDEGEVLVAGEAIGEDVEFLDAVEAEVAEVVAEVAVGDEVPVLSVENDGEGIDGAGGDLAAVACVVVDGDATASTAAS